MSYEIIEKLKKQIEGFSDESKLEDFGQVIEAADGVVKISGLAEAMSQEMITIETEEGDVKAVAFNLEENTVGAVALGDFSHVKVGNAVKPTGKVLSVPVGKELIGRVINPLGEPIDGKGQVFSAGAKAIDSMIPIGRGQRELIIGDRQTGKTTIAIDTIINQKSDVRYPTPICIYV